MKTTCCVIPGIGNVQKRQNHTERRSDVAGGWGRGEWAVNANGYKASFWGDGKVWNRTGVMLVQLRKFTGKIMKLYT